MEIKLGSEVVDSTTGFKGIAVHRIEQLNGNIQYAVQAKCPEGSTDRYPDAIQLDYHLLDVVGPGVSDRTTPVTETTVFELGTELEDKVTGMRGIATERGTYMNGCIGYMLIGKVDNKKPDTSNALTAWVQVGRLKKVSNGIKEEVKVAPDAPSGKKPGGPAKRLTRAAVQRV